MKMKWKWVFSLLALMELPGIAMAQTRFDLAFVGGPLAPEAIGMKQFADEIASFTDGRYEIRLQGGGALGGDRDVVEGVQLGTIEMTVVATSVVANFVPDFVIYDVPFLFRDLNHAESVFDSPLGAEIMATLPDAGMQGLAIGTIGFRQLTNNLRPVTSVEDVAGLKIRTQQNDLHIEAWERLGALPTPMSVTEVYSALQQGVIDGQENPVGAIINNRFGEVQRYLSLTNHALTPVVLLMNANIYDRMTAQDQQIFRTAAVNAMGRVKVEVEKVQENGLEALYSAGIEVTTNVDGEDFRAHLAPMLDRLRERFGTHLDTIRATGQ